MEVVPAMLRRLPWSVLQNGGDERSSFGAPVRISQKFPSLARKPLDLLATLFWVDTPKSSFTGRHIAMMVIKYIPFLIFSRDMPRITDETERPRTSVKMDHTPAYMLAIVVWCPHTGNSHFFNVQKQQTGKACDFCSWQNFSAIGSLSATVTSSPTCEYHFLGPEILGPFRIHIPVPRMPMIYDSIDVRPCCWFYGCWVEGEVLRRTGQILFLQSWITTLVV